MTIPWGDVSTAYHSTGIGNVEVYMGLPAAMIWQMQVARYFGWMLRLPLLQESIKALISAGAPGPNARTRAATRAVIWGQARNRTGKRATARLHTPNGYALTAMTALRAAQNAVGGEIKPGFQTPSRAFGEDFILQFDGVRREDIDG